MSNAMLLCKQFKLLLFVNLYKQAHFTSNMDDYLSIKRV